MASNVEHLVDHFLSVHHAKLIEAASAARANSGEALDAIVSSVKSSAILQQIGLAVSTSGDALDQLGAKLRRLVPAADTFVGLCLVGMGAVIMIEAGAALGVLLGIALIAIGICKAVPAVQQLALQRLQGLVEDQLPSW